MSSSCCPVCYRGTDPNLNPIGRDKHDPIKVRGKQKRFFQLLERYLLMGKTEGQDEKNKRFPFPLEQFGEIGMISCMDCLIMMETFCQLFHQLKTIELLLDWQLQKVKDIMVGSQRVTSRMKYFREFIGNLPVEATDCRWGTAKEMMSCIVKSKKLLIAKCSEKVSNSYPKLEVAKCDAASKPLNGMPIKFQYILKSSTTHVDEEEEPDSTNNSATSVALSAVGTSQAIEETPNEVINISKESVIGGKLSNDDNVPFFTTEEVNFTPANPQETQDPPPGFPSSETYFESDVETGYLGEGSQSVVGNDNLHSLVSASNNDEMDVDHDDSTIESAELQIAKIEANDVTETIGSNNSQQHQISDFATVPLTSPVIIIDIDEVPRPTENQGRRSSLRAKHRCEHCGKTFPLLQRLQLHVKECQSQDSDPKYEDDSDNYSESDTYSKINNNDSDNSSLFSSSSEEEVEFDPGFVSSNNYKGAKNSKLDVKPACALDITKCQKQPNPGHRLSLKCPDCGDLYHTFKAFLMHRKDSESCKASYDPTASVRVEVLASASDNQNIPEDPTPAFTQFAMIELAQEISMCTECELAFYSPSDLEKHKELHGRFPCNFCDLEFTYAPKLSLHELQHSKVDKSNWGNNRLPCCPRCDVRYTSKQIMSHYLRHHLKVHLSLTPNEPSCAICKITARYLEPSELAEHLKSHHDLTNDKTPQRCTMSGCGAYYLTKEQLQEHLKIYHVQVQERDNRGGRKCKDCERSFYKTGDLNKHRLKHHANSTSNTLIKCQKAKCSRAFNCQADLDVHTKKMHSSRNTDEIVKLKCPDCSLLFVDIKGLLLHRNDPDECVPPQDPTTIISVEVMATPRNENSLEQLSEKTVFAVVDLPQEIYICKVCGFESFSLDDKEAHNGLHGSFKCRFCHVTRTYAPDIAKHARKHADRKKHGAPKGIQCPQCDLNWKESGNGAKMYIHHYLKAHMSLTFNEMKCSICKTGPAIHRAPFKLGQHLKQFHDLTNAKSPGNIKRCTLTNCNSYFLTKLQLRIHLKRRHSIDLGVDKRKYKCNDCGNCYFKLQPLRAHRIKYHVNSDKVLPCVFENCFVVFESKEDLINHITADGTLNYHKPLDHRRPIKDVQCPTCEASFNGSDPKFLVEHMQSNHGEEKPTHVCEFCGKVFKLKDRLEKHYLSHSGPESWQFQCSVCSKKCIDKHKLAEHMRTHTKDKQFVCQVCGQAYAHRHNLRIHVNNKHGDVIQDVPRKFTKTNLGSRKGTKRKKVEVETDETCSSDDAI